MTKGAILEWQLCWPSTVANVAYSMPVLRERALNQCRELHQLRDAAPLGKKAAPVLTEFSQCGGLG